MRQLIRWSASTFTLVVMVFAGCIKPPPPPFKAPRFDQERAFRRLQDLCSFGPRNHGSEGKSKAEEWIKQSLRDGGAEVSVHEFQHTPKGMPQSETFRNIIGRINPDLKARVLIATHFDTRSTADKDPNYALRNEPIIGANDGGSGVAVLLEMAALWKVEPPPVGVDLIFFDGEDFGRDQDLDEYFLGSKAYTRDFRLPTHVGRGSRYGRRLSRYQERAGLWARAPTVIDRLWSARVDRPVSSISVVVLITMTTAFLNRSASGLSN